MLGVGLQLLLLNLLLQALTLIVRRWDSWPITLRPETQVLLTVPLVAVCLLVAWRFNRSLDLVQIHLQGGHRQLVTTGPCAP